MAKRSIPQISSNPSAVNRPTYMRAWREFAGLSIKEMSDKLKQLGLKRSCSVRHLKQLECKQLPPDNRKFSSIGDCMTIDGYGEICGFSDEEVFNLPPCRGSVYQWFLALPREQQKRAAERLYGFWEARTSDALRERRPTLHRWRR
jgi:transcriptional regulator with XRE-family HTH domain